MEKLTIWLAISDTDGGTHAHCDLTEIDAENSLLEMADKSRDEFDPWAKGSGGANVCDFVNETSDYLDTFNLYSQEIALPPPYGAAPAMLAALQELVRCVRGGDETAGFSMDDALEDADNAIAAATGSPTGGAEPASPTDDTEAEAQTYTAFCQQSDGCGTIWIDTVEVPAGTDNPIRDARERAIAACSFDWNYDPASVHCLGLVLGDATVCYWDDLADA